MHLVDTTKTLPILVSTVRDRLNSYTPREVADAKTARKLLNSLGYAEPGTLVKMIINGAITECPITSADVIRAYVIWVANLKGKTTIKKPEPINVEPFVRILEKMQVIRTNVLSPFMSVMTTSWCSRGEGGCLCTWLTPQRSYLYW